MTKAHRNENARYITAQMATQRYNLCRGKVTALAKTANAFIKIGACARIDTEKLDRYLEDVLSVKE